MGADIGDLDPEQADRSSATCGATPSVAEEYFTGLLDRRRHAAARAGHLGGRRARPGHRVLRGALPRSGTSSPTRPALVVLDEAGHYFLKYRAEELAEIVTQVHRRSAAGDARPASAPRCRRVRTPVGGSPAPAVADAAAADAAAASRSRSRAWRRFLAVAAGQLVSITGLGADRVRHAAVDLPATGSLADLGLLCGRWPDPRHAVRRWPARSSTGSSRRTVMMLAGDVAAGADPARARRCCSWTGDLALWHVYPLLAALSVALTFQRLAYVSAVPQLVPKRYLGHANGHRPARQRHRAVAGAAARRRAAGHDRAARASC